MSETKSFLFAKLNKVIVVPWKVHVKPHDLLVLSVQGLFYLFMCLICMLCYTSQNLQGFDTLIWSITSSDYSGRSMPLLHLFFSCPFLMENLVYLHLLNLLCHSHFPPCFALFHFLLPQFLRVPPRAFLHLQARTLL